MHAASRSLIIACTLSALSLSGAASLRAQTIEVVEYPQVQEQPAQAAAPAQAKEEARDETAGKSEAAPEHAAPQLAAAQTREAARAAPEQPAAEQPARQTPAPAAKVDLSTYAAGTIVVETSERKLHLVLGNGQSITYPVGVGKSGRAWAGSGAISGKRLWPAWSPPQAIRRVKPWLHDVYAGGSPENPMGAAAMTLTVDQYAIHGTNDDSSIGGFVSFGCIRMHNADVLDLFKRVHVGTRVVVLR
jgi:lipoprotein-anchoring transpeptidase ErfK/SrfK